MAVLLDRSRDAVDQEACNGGYVGLMKNRNRGAASVQTDEVHGNVKHRHRLRGGGTTASATTGLAISIRQRPR